MQNQNMKIHNRLWLFNKMNNFKNLYNHADRNEIQFCTENDYYVMHTEYLVFIASKCLFNSILLNFTLSSE